jgi:hypothetical protein
MSIKKHFKSLKDISQHISEIRLRDYSSWYRYHGCTFTMYGIKGESARRNKNEIMNITNEGLYFDVIYYGISCHIDAKNWRLQVFGEEVLE